MKELLEELGLSPYKQDAYLALVALETGSVGQIAKKSGIPTSKLYEVLAWLHEEGYVAQVSEKPLLYRAHNPKHVIQTRLQERIDHFEKLHHKAAKIRTEIEVVEQGLFHIVYGRDAFLRKVKEACRKTKKSIYGVFKHWRVDAELLALEEELRFVDKRFLGPIEESTMLSVKERVKRGAKVRHYIPDSTRFTVWDGHLVVISLRKGTEKNYYSLWIDNPTLGKIMTLYFKKLWKSAETPLDEHELCM